MMINVYGFFRRNPMSHLKLLHHKSRYSSGEDPTIRKFQAVKMDTSMFWIRYLGCEIMGIIKGLLTIGFP